MVVVRVRQRHGANTLPGELLREKIDQFLREPAVVEPRYEIRGRDLVQLDPACGSVGNHQAFRGFDDEVLEAGAHAANEVDAVGQFDETHVYPCRPVLAGSFQRVRAGRRLP